MEKIEAGNLAFWVDSREGNNDGGPSIYVYASVDGRDEQILRFDCFRERPHYHYHPSGENVQWRIDPTLVPNSLGWTLARLREDLGTMIVKAGFPEVAKALDASAVAGAADKVEDHFKASVSSSA